MMMDVRVGNTEDLETFKRGILPNLARHVDKINRDEDDCYWFVEASYGMLPAWRVSIKTAGITTEAAVRKNAVAWIEVRPDSLKHPLLRFDLTVTNGDLRPNDYMLYDPPVLDQIAKLIRERGAAKRRLAAFLGWFSK